jgi:hypothetical protein
MHDISQFKLTCGDEIICEVMEWPDSEGDYILRNVMSLTITFDDNYIPRYSLRPWMTYIDSPTELITVSKNHVMASAFPNEFFITEYEQSILELKIMRKKRDAYNKLLEQENEKKLKESVDRVMKEMGMKDSSDDLEDDYDNVILFPSGDDTLH